MQQIDLNGQSEEQYYLNLLKNSDACKEGRLNVYNCYRVPRKFNSRSSATWRRYLYLFPLQEGPYQYQGESFDVDINFANKMLAQIENKELPFDSFTFGDIKDQGLGLRDLCTIFRGRAQVVDLNNGLNDEKPNKAMCVELVGSRFLRRMVRILVGTLVRESQYANEDRNEKLLLDICLSKDRTKTTVALPGEALCLAGVGYDHNDLAIYKFMPKLKYNEVMKELMKHRDPVGCSEDE